MTALPAMLLIVAVPLGPTSNKKLIVWGAGAPDTRQFRDQIKIMEKTPFDGTVISATGKDGLLPSFMDGIFEGAAEKTSLVDANEFAYPYKTRKEFEFLFVHTHVGGRSMSAIPDLYDKRVSVGFGIWMDCDWRGVGWDPVHTEKNHFQPNELRNSLREALDLSNRYVWLYSEKVNWWTGEGLSEPYAQAVKKALADLTTHPTPSK